MEPVIIAVTAILLMAFWYHANYYCALCYIQLTARDYMSNGRIRYRKRGTQLPVCRCCGSNNPKEVD